ncbi:MAG: NAD-dependent malic enzyme, partial [Deinococcales bacterium]
MSTLEEQITRVYNAYSSHKDDLNKHIYLRLLQDRNEVLFYALLERHLEEMMPIIYTPTVGKAVEEFSNLYRFPRGLVVSTENIHRLDKLLENVPYPYVKLIVATDAEGILGIGDQGFGGIAICIGKLSLYTAAAGVDPALTLPVQLDVGTNREDLLNNPLYLGVRHERLVGDAYYDFIERFVTGLKKYHPNTLLQWEDFSRQKAFDVLERHQDEILSFNDDIQGTGATVVAGLLAASRKHGRKLSEEVFLLYGAGAGGVGVARQIYAALRDEGLSEQEAKARIFMMDPFGLVLSDRVGLESFKQSLAQDPAALANWQLNSTSPSLLEVITNAKVTVLLGLSGQAGAFSEVVITALCANSPKPIIFPLSNPTANCEATPQDLLLWSKGQATIATGSPFADVNYEGKRYSISQGNNAFIFPGLGLGLMLSGASKVSPEMLTAASKALADNVSEGRLDQGCVFPRVSQIREVSKQVAIKVIEAAISQG